jgi:hypothetical protein
MAKNVRNVRNDQLIYQLIPTFSSPSKIHRNWDFWYENVQSGNPVSKQKTKQKARSWQARFNRHKIVLDKREIKRGTGAISAKLDPLLRL